MFRLAVLGAGFSSLKFISLVRSLPFSIRYFSIDLYCENEYFVFLPLLPNYIDRTFPQNPSISISSFCSYTSTRLFKSNVYNNNLEYKSIIFDGRKIIYSFIFDGRSLDKNHYHCRHNDAFNLLASIESANPYCNLYDFSIASYEISQSIRTSLDSRIKNIPISITAPLNRSFSTHPLFRKIFLSSSYPMPSFIPLSRPEITSSLLTSIKSSSLIFRSSAQLASKSAKLGLLNFLLSSSRDLFEHALSLRGNMFYLGLHCALIQVCIFNSPISLPLPAKILSFIRLLYYRLQFYVYYTHHTSIYSVRCFKFVYFIFWSILHPLFILLLLFPKFKVIIK